VSVNLNKNADTVLRALARAQHLFGGQTSSSPPPEFAPPRDLEDNLGLGFFGPSAPAPAAPAAYARPPQRVVEAGSEDPHVADDATTIDDLHERLVTGGAWAWADKGLGGGR